jgi:hypothetical protein
MFLGLGIIIFTVVLNDSYYAYDKLSGKENW